MQSSYFGEGIRHFSMVKSSSFKNGLPHITPSGRIVEFTPKYIIVGGDGGVSDFLKGSFLFFR